MKRLNPETNTYFKFGDVRDDGYIFQQYIKNKIKENGFFTELWYNPFSFFAHKNNRKRLVANWAKNNKELMLEYGKKYTKRNPHKRNAKAAKHRADKRQATPSSLTKEHLQQIKDIFCMAKELEKIFPWKQHVDHIIPLKHLKVCGLHAPWNLQILSEKMNLEKSNKWSQE